MALNYASNSMFLATETDFGLSLLRHAPTNGSLVVSPLSVMFALALVQLGAKGNTKAQINSLLSKGASDRAIVEHYSQLSHQIMEAESGVRTRIGNAFFLNKNYRIRNDYEAAITSKYSAKVESLDFGKAEESATIIDGYISDVTEGKIQNMVTADSLRGTFSLIVNAIYFTAEWMFNFSKANTIKEKFFTSKDSWREIEFMNDYAENRLYAEDSDFEVLSLQYKDKTYAFNIFLPKKWFGLKELKKALDGNRIQTLLSKLHGDFLTVTIPKIKIETDYELKEALMQMGITDLFSGRADLTGVAVSPSLIVDDIAHRAVIEVDEEGTTAAAATVVEFAPLSALPKSPVPFVANHPFLFVLTKDRNPLFMGQFV